MYATANWSPVNEGPGSALTDADYANLARRWIDNQLAEAARIRRVDSNTGRLLVGRRDHGSYEGLAIPYFLPGELGIREWRLRRDHPDIEYKDDKPKERGKYLSPPGRKNMIYFVPGITQDLVNAVATPVIVTEGEFKTLALWGLANHESTAPRFLPLGLAGVRSWRGTVGKTTGPNGSRRDVKGVIPDLDLVVWEGRRVIIAFDADADKNEQVEIARNLLARELWTRGAEVAFVAWDIAFKPNRLRFQIVWGWNQTLGCTVFLSPLHLLAMQDDFSPICAPGQVWQYIVRVHRLPDHRIAGDAKRSD
jgi:hypothetical protein